MTALAAEVIMEQEFRSRLEPESAILPDPESEF